MVWLYIRPNFSSDLRFMYYKGNFSDCHWAVLLSFWRYVSVQRGCNVWILGQNPKCEPSNEKATKQYPSKHGADYYAVKVGSGRNCSPVYKSDNSKSMETFHHCFPGSCLLSKVMVVIWVSEWKDHCDESYRGWAVLSLRYTGCFCTVSGRMKSSDESYWAVLSCSVMFVRLLNWVFFWWSF